jgi:uncharacterized ferritin-like protein (DUF455 family)
MARLRILGVQEEHRLVVRAVPGLTIAQHARTACLELVARGVDILDLVADMVDAAVGIAREESRDRRLLAQRLQQLDLGIGQFNEHDRDAVRRQRLGGAHLGAHHVAIERRGLGEVGHGDGDMVQAADHEA